MTKLLEKAFAEACKLPEVQQDEIAGWLLAEIESEQRWDAAFRVREISSGALPKRL